MILKNKILVWLSECLEDVKKGLEYIEKEIKMITN